MWLLAIAYVQLGYWALVLSLAVGAATLSEDAKSSTEAGRVLYYKQQTVFTE